MLYRTTTSNVDLKKPQMWKNSMASHGSGIPSMHNIYIEIWTNLHRSRLDFMHKIPAPRACLGELDRLSSWHSSQLCGNSIIVHVEKRHANPNHPNHKHFLWWMEHSIPHSITNWKHGYSKSDKHFGLLYIIHHYFIP